MPLRHFASPGVSRSSNVPTSSSSVFFSGLAGGLPAGAATAGEPQREQRLIRQRIGQIDLAGIPVECGTLFGGHAGDVQGFESGREELVASARPLAVLVLEHDEPVGDLAKQAVGKPFLGRRLVGEQTTESRDDPYRFIGLFPGSAVSLPCHRPFSAGLRPSVHCMSAALRHPCLRLLPQPGDMAGTPPSWLLTHKPPGRTRFQPARIPGKMAVVRMVVQTFARQSRMPLRWFSRLKTAGCLSVGSRGRKPGCRRFKSGRRYFPLCMRMGFGTIAHRRTPTASATRL